ncbi:hypothetical protein PGTUg99_017822 [Puccinia graminis f. sp. tritici]|uniref:Uncharacterized protein n=1 Tax=Puccinia graminis f. sp. tritici TaxID=56615 RepID=A0A5B0SBE5_PUCGR|nr:hypothetical protein PGTUg99_017822 [Puccinia graminis f. sp. tritici]
MIASHIGSHLSASGNVAWTSRMTGIRADQLELTASCMSKNSNYKLISSWRMNLIWGFLDYGKHQTNSLQ